MTYCSVVTILALVGLTKKRFDHYATFKILSLRSPSTKLSTACIAMHNSAWHWENNQGNFKAIVLDWAGLCLSSFSRTAFHYSAVKRVALSFLRMILGDLATVM